MDIKCSYCEQLLPSQSARSHHHKRKHKIEHEQRLQIDRESRKLECPNCHLYYLTKGSLRKHQYNCNAQQVQEANPTIIHSQKTDIIDKTATEETYKEFELQNAINERIVNHAHESQRNSQLVQDPCQLVHYISQLVQSQLVHTADKCIQTDISIPIVNQCNSKHDLGIDC